MKKIMYVCILILAGCATNNSQHTEYNFNGNELYLVVNEYKNNEQFKDDYRRIFEKEPPQSIENKIYQGIDNELRKINIRNNSNADNKLFIDIDFIEIITIDIPGKDINKFNINISLRYADIYNRLV